ncbi:hypothetical protein GPECTOR_26g540 [Gonium pectorale]|uniref:Saposin B-type domain-containing protein n=1 Tax=Gonium pectorale TaxID=33097 RepID=A0A150GFK4_GONPE|nr:hypothetical protein GPECTOR_26g540 [Gonium pectorale]|eukprot:KXZ48637.1 hypothetical protein GPECTOR_26g540 [Gonium pectorale]
MKRNNLLRLLLLALVVAASAQFGGPKRPKKKSPVAKDDIKYIKCQVCEAIAKQARNIKKDLQAVAGPKKVSEGDLLDKFEKMCDPEQDDGDWITQFDIVEEGSALKLKDTGMMGKCKSECRTIAYACEKILDDVDLTELSSLVYAGKKRAAVTNWLCHESSDACESKPPPVPKGRRADERHVPMSEDEVRTEKMLRNMKAAGLSGSMYSRETLEEELAEMAGEYSDDPDFAKAMADSGLDKHLQKGTEEEPTAADATAEQPSVASSVANAAAGAASSLTEAASKAAESIKEGAAKVVEGAKNVVGKLFGGGGKQEEAGGNEL